MENVEARCLRIDVDPSNGWIYLSWLNPPIGLMSVKRFKDEKVIADDPGPVKSPLVRNGLGAFGGPICTSLDPKSCVEAFSFLSSSLSTGGTAHPTLVYVFHRRVEHRDGVTLKSYGSEVLLQTFDTDAFEHPDTTVNNGFSDEKAVSEFSADTHNSFHGAIACDTAGTCVVVFYDQALSDVAPGDDQPPLYRVYAKHIKYDGGTIVDEVGNLVDEHQKLLQGTSDSSVFLKTDGVGHQLQYQDIFYRKTSWYAASIVTVGSTSDVIVNRLAPGEQCPLAIVSQPEDPPCVKDGHIPVMTVAVDGCGPFGYQWYSGNSGEITHPVIGAITNTFTAQPTAARYWVRVTDHSGISVDSRTVFVDGFPPRHRAVLRVGSPGEVTAFSIGNHSSAELSVDLDPGETVSWTANDDARAYPSGTESTITVSPELPTSYTAAITNACGTATTAPVFVGLCEKPQITVSPMSASVQQDHDVRKLVSAHIEASGLPVYKWFEGEKGDESHPVPQYDGSEQQTLYAVGNTSTLASSNVMSTRVWARISSQDPDCVEVTQSEAVTLAITSCTPPVLGGVAYGGETIQGEGVQFMVITDEAYPPPQTNPYTFQWYRGSDHQPIVGQTLQRMNASTNTFETYYCVVTKHCDATHSVSTTSSLGYLWQRGVCDFPPLQTSQSAADIGSTSSIVFTAYDDWPDVVFDWYEGEAGDTRTHVQADAGAPNRLTVYRPTYRPRPYWVRASLPCGAHHDSATLIYRKNGCTPILFTPQPQSPPITSGDNFTLKANTPFVSPALAASAYDWFRIDENDPTLHFVDSHSSSYSSSILKTTLYGVRVSNKCSDAEPGTATIDSQIAVVRVDSCPSMTGIQWPADKTVIANTDDTLTVNGDQAVIYQWYKGELGDVSTPVGDGTNTLHLHLAASTSYWVRLTSGSCSADSATIHVNVCVPASSPIAAVFLKQTINRGGSAGLVYPFVGTNLTYQWYVGDNTDTSHPFGGSADSIRVSGINDTMKFWVSAQAPCGLLKKSDTFVISVRPPIYYQPVAALDPVMPGVTTTLTADGGLPSATFEWYKGEVGDTLHPFGTNSLTVTTPPITADTKFWLRIRSGDAYTDSDPVTVHLCAPPEMHWMTANPAFVASGTQVTMTFSQPEDGSEIVWYQGVSGDLANSTRIGPSYFPYFQTAPLTQTTTYWARVTKGNCWSDTPTFTVNVCVPVIVHQPESTLIDSGTTAALSVTATPANATYQWYEGLSGNTANPISATTSSFTTLPLTATKNYWVRVTGTCGTPVDSDTATVTVCQPPTIQSTAISSNIGTAFSIVQGQSANCSVIANGTNLTYQWYTGVSGNTSSPINGANGTQVTVTPQDTSSYWVRVTGSCGAVNSATLTISVCAVPVITTQPQSVTIFSGGTTTLSIATTEGTSSAVTYQWYRGNSGDQSVPVGTGATFTTPALTTAISYWVRASCGVCNPVDSQTATVSICPIAANLASPGDVNIAIGQSASLSTVTGSGNTYQWYTGASGNTSQSAGCTTATCSFSPTVTTSYWCRVTNGTCVSSTPSGTVYVCIPTITSHPQSIMINPGASTTLTVAANTAGLTYQWYTGTSGTTTSPLSGQTGASLTVTPASATNYWVRVTGTCGQSVNSNTAAVTICQPPSMTVPLPTQSIIRGQSTTIYVNPSGTNLTYQWYIGPAGNVGASTAIGTAASSITVSPQDTTAYWVRITGTCGVANSTAITVNVCVSPTITSQPQSVSIFSGATATLSVASSEPTSTPVTYQWYRGNAGDTSASVGTGSSFTTPALTTATNYWVRLSCGVCNPVDSQTATVSICTYPASLASPGTFNIALGQTAHLATVSGAGNSYQWYLGASGNTSQPYSNSAAIDVSPSTTTSYWCRVQNGTCVSSTATATVNVCVPTFTQQPSSTTITAGSSTTLTSAADTAGVTYRWYVGATGNTASPVTNGTNASLTVTPSSTTSYWVRATGSCGVTTDSATATVTICQPPAITAQPQNASPVNYNGVANLSVSATGSNLTYQWYYGDSGDTSLPVSGATSSTFSYSIQNTVKLWVRVSGQCGSVNSSMAWGSVYPSISVQPAASLSVGYGSTASTTLTAQGTYLHYVWKWANGTLVSGAPDSPALITPSITADSSAYCQVTSGIASVNSGSTAMTVCYDGPAINSITKGNGYISVSTGFVYDIKWYQGVRGDVSHLVASGSNVMYASPSTATPYWCRVFSSTTGTEPTCYTDSSVVTLP